MPNIGRAVRRAAEYVTAPIAKVTDPAKRLARKATVPLRRKLRATSAGRALRKNPTFKRLKKNKYVRKAAVVGGAILASPVDDLAVMAIAGKKAKDSNKKKR